MLCALLLFLAPRVSAQSLQHITYVGGTALGGSGLHGSLSLAPPDSLVFEGSTRLVIPYDRVATYESASHRQVHVGLLTEGLWRLLAPWPETRRLTLTYRDGSDRPQVVVLEMSHGDEALLLEVLKARVPRARGTPLVPAPSAKP